MDWLERHFAIFSEPGLVLVIGAGQGRDLPALQAHPDCRVLLVEPQPRFADDLRRKTRGRPGVEVIQSALDESSGESELQVFNFPELSCLRPDPTLETRFPGARLTSRLTVETLSLSDLVQKCAIGPGSNHWLIADVPGLQRVVLNALQDADLTRCFPHVVLRSSGGTEHQSDLGSLADAFFERGYRDLGEEDTGDHEGSRVHFLHVDRFPLRSDLEQKIQGLEQQLMELSIDKDDLREQLSEARLASEVRQSEIAFRDERTRKLGRLHEARVADLEKQISSLRMERDQRLESMDAAMGRTKENLSLSLRLQALRENELRELRERYETVLETRETQHALLCNIRERLDIAAEFLLELKDEHDEGRRVELTSNLLQALTHIQANHD